MFERYSCQILLKDGALLDQQCISLHRQLSPTAQYHRRHLPLCAYVLWNDLFMRLSHILCLSGCKSFICLVMPACAILPRSVVHHWWFGDSNNLAIWVNHAIFWQYSGNIVLRNILAIFSQYFLQYSGNILAIFLAILSCAILWQYSGNSVLS
jgi:hypothetical protein